MGTLFVFLDEITYVKDWEYEIKTLADSGRLSKVCIVVTGSSPSSLKKGAELLPGRGLSGNEYLFHPFTFREFAKKVGERIAIHSEDDSLKEALNNLVKHLGGEGVGLNNIQEFKDVIDALIPFQKELDFLFSIYAFTGGFPESANSHFISRFVKKDHMEEFVDPTIFEDMMRIIFSDIRKLNRREVFAAQILRGLIKRLESRYSFNVLSRDKEDGISREIVEEYIDMLEKSFLIKLLYSCDLTRKEPRPKADRKIFFRDPFIYNSVKRYLTAIPLREIMDEETTGKLAEGIVGQHILVSEEVRFLREANNFLWFYYTKNREIDFIYLTEEGELRGLEVKYQHSVSPREVKCPPQIPFCFVITRNQWMGKKTSYLFLSLYFWPLSAKLKRHFRFYHLFG